MQNVAARHSRSHLQESALPSRLRTKIKNADDFCYYVVCIASVWSSGRFFAYQVVQIHSYKTNAKEFYTTAISAGAKLENVGNDIHKNWNDYIYNRYSVYGSIESAVAAAQRDHASEISLIKASTAVLEDKYQKLLKLPLLKGDEVEEIRDAVKEAYTAYEDLYNCVIDVKGNYRTYTENFSDFDTQASKALRALDALLEE